MKNNIKRLWLDYECPVGSMVQWKNIKQELFVGKLLNIETNDVVTVATIELENGEIVKVRC